MDNYEIWKDCKGYEGKYQVSNQGRVWSVAKQTYMTPYLENSGYYSLHLKAKNGKSKKEYIHRLVALAFKDNPHNYPEVHHIDANPLNNCADNLEWITHQSNLNQKERLEKISKKIKCIETGECFNSIKEAAAAKKISAGHIGEVCKGKRKTCGGYHWQYWEVS